MATAAKQVVKKKPIAKAKPSVVKQKTLVKAKSRIVKRSSSLSVKPFTMRQNQCIERGQILTGQLTEKVNFALGKTNLKFKSKRHHYIVGPSGIGKSLTVRNVAKKHKVELVEITGAASMSAVAISLACAAYRANGKPIYVWIDDCDSVFLDRNSLSVMKGALDEDRNVLSWNKNMTVQIQQYEKSTDKTDLFRAAALREYQTSDGVGLEIPTDNISFIITSNHPLAPSNPPPKTARAIDEAAIHDRVAYTQYGYDRDLCWGWTASVTMNNNIQGLTQPQKRILLDWMDVNWERLQSVSMRAVMELASEMLNYPRNYPDYWASKLKVN